MDIIDPDENGAAAGWLTAQEDQVGPGFAMQLDAKLGPVSIMPNYQTNSHEFDSNATNVNAGADTGFKAWGFALPVKVKLGPVSLAAAYAWGENIGNMSTKWNAFGKGSQTVTVAANAAGNPTFFDTDYTAWNIKADVNAGIGKLMVGYAYEEQDAFATLTTRTVMEADVLSIAYAIPVGKGFTITPKYNRFDYGEAKTNGVVNPATDDNTAKIYTLNFNVRF